MVELNVELLAKENDNQKMIRALADREIKVLKSKLGQIMDLEGLDDLSTCDWKILRQEEGGGNKKELQEKHGTEWIRENSKDGNPIVKFYVRKKKLGE